MPEIIVAQRMWQRRDTAANWTAVNPVLASGEIGFEMGPPIKMKVGNGADAWVALAYFAGGSGSSESSIVFGGGDRVNFVTLGLKSPQPIDFAATILRWRLITDNPAGTITIDLRKNVFASYPPSVGDSIVAAAPPALSASDHGTNATLTGWTTAIDPGDVILPVITAIGGVRWWNLTLHIQKV